MTFPRLSSSALALAIASLAATVALAAPASAAPNAADRSWLAAAHQGNLAEIAAGHSALKKASSSQVKQIGQMFITDHTTLDSQLSSTAKQLGVVLPDSPTPSQQQQLAAVESKTGSAYDSAWLAVQITDHRETLTATEQELSTGSDQNVLALARAATPVIEKHLAELQKAAGTATSVNAGTGGKAAISSSEPAMLMGVGVVLVLAAGLLHLRRRSKPTT